uniref:Uncharacterized protein n=1 Tax=Knipowitschia caucasica TaxID=637954 RepID=A0AAV2K2D1_KNICA
MTCRGVLHIGPHSGSNRVDHRVPHSGLTPSVSTAGSADPDPLSGSVRGSSAAQFRGGCRWCRGRVPRWLRCLRLVSAEAARCSGVCAHYCGTF